jgi:hypothetical protein
VGRLSHRERLSKDDLSSPGCDPLLEGTLAVVAEETDRAGTPLLDEWIDQAGEPTVIASIRVARAAIEDGSTPGFTDPQAMLQYLGRRPTG